MPRTLNKPAGLPVFPPHNDATGDCLLRRLLEAEPWRREITWPAGFAGGIAHRLDNVTSGAVIAANDLAELQWLRDGFRGHRFTKTYLLLSDGDVPWDEDACDRAIAHHPRRRSRMVVQRGKNTPHRGKWYPAETRFRRVRWHLWEATMQSGVMHQIRVHAAFLGIPLQGDRLYGGAAVMAKGIVEADGDNEARASFCLHHVGLTGPDGFRSEPVPPPDWAPAAMAEK
jgi:23S rRNA pseudouridine1911/1915/1917 synthase